MTLSGVSAVRRLERPRRVQVDPRRLWVPPRQPRRRVLGPGLGELAESLDPRFGEEWIPAIQHAWARLRVGRTTEWYGEVAVELCSVNRLEAVTLRQWVPADSLRLPPEHTA
ncbi:hypothetical protein [Nocardia carnea]|uniref:hypothetical protein n=1 Tax=Nocardia carnea TaxID=37328 RepID=UPI0024569354|nr:hypothetical protein [Nocardia carnea]